MPFTDDDFVRTRPFLFHLTSSTNIHGIRKSHTLRSAASVMQEAGDTSFLRRRRTSSIQVRLATATVSIRDQQPLYVGNMRLADGCSFDDFIQLLNEQVFF